MAKRKKRARAQAKKRAKLRRTRKASKSAQRRGTKRSVARAKPKRAVKGVARKKRQRMKSLGREVQTVVVDVIEEPAPGVITITEYEETQVPRESWVKTERDGEA